MDPTIDREELIVDWVAGWRHEALTPIFEGLTALGDATFFLFAFTLGYWLLDRRVFLRVSLVLMITAVLNSLLKGVFQAPRPDESLRLVEASGWSFPSGHAMIAGAIWPWLARESNARPRRGWVHVGIWLGAMLLALGIALSRVYLGVHHPRDVAVGLLLGVGVFAGLWWLADMTPPVWSQLRWIQKASLVVVPVVLLLWILPSSGDGDDTLAKAGGALIGLVLGADWERRRLRFLPPHGWWRVAVGLVGVAGIFGLRVGLKALFEGFEPTVGSTIRYVVIALFLSAVAPWLFVRLGWCATEVLPEVETR